MDWIKIINAWNAIIIDSSKYLTLPYITLSYSIRVKNLTILWPTLIPLRTSESCRPDTSPVRDNLTCLESSLGDFVQRDLREELVYHWSPTVWKDETTQSHLVKTTLTKVTYWFSPHSISLTSLYVWNTKWWWYKWQVFKVIGRTTQV